MRSGNNASLSFMIRRLIPVILLSLLIFPRVKSQGKPSFLALDGYFTTMQSVITDSIPGSLINGNLIHNRLNLKGYINQNITFAAEFRNRLFTGDMVKGSPLLAGMIGSDPGWADLSWNVLNENSYLLNIKLDRLWMDFNYGKFQARIGRQRINWGQTLIWNPNDVFNAYSFFDFDYIERPGSDAVRLQYFPSSTSALEIAVKADNKNKITTAALYRFNRWGYDIQFLAGYTGSEDLMAGAGWSGTAGSFSFRGEASWFQPAGKSSGEKGTGIFTIGFDRSFKNNSTALLQSMFCNNPVSLENFTDVYYGNLTAKQIAFSKFTLFGQYTYPVTPLFNISLSAMWFPDLQGYYAGPSFDYSVAQNVDLSLYWQHFTTRAQNIDMGFLRVKISF